MGAVAAAAITWSIASRGTASSRNRRMLRLESSSASSWSKVARERRRRQVDHVARGELPAGHGDAARGADHHALAAGDAVERRGMVDQDLPGRLSPAPRPGRSRAFAADRAGRPVDDGMAGRVPETADDPHRGPPVVRRDGTAVCASIPGAASRRLRRIPPIPAAADRRPLIPAQPKFFTMHGIFRTASGVRPGRDADRFEGRPVRGRQRGHRLVRHPSPAARVDLRLHRGRGDDPHPKVAAPGQAGASAGRAGALPLVLRQAPAGHHPRLPGGIRRTEEMVGEIPDGRPDEQSRWR